MYPGIPFNMVFFRWQKESVHSSEGRGHSPWVRMLRQGSLLASLRQSEGLITDYDQSEAEPDPWCQGMGPCERAICLSLFVCLAMAVFTTVGLIYLTAIVYNPVKNELEAGFLTNPVMCTSILNQTVRENAQAFGLCCNNIISGWLQCGERLVLWVVHFWPRGCLHKDLGRGQTKWDRCYVLRVQWCEEITRLADLRDKP